MRAERPTGSFIISRKSKYIKTIDQENSPEGLMTASHINWAGYPSGLLVSLFLGIGLKAPRQQLKSKNSICSSGHLFGDLIHWHIFPYIRTSLTCMVHIQYVHIFINPLSLTGPVFLHPIPQGTVFNRFGNRKYRLKVLKLKVPSV